MDISRILPTIKLFLTAVIFIYLVRSCVKTKQLVMFIENFKRKTARAIVDFVESNLDEPSEEEVEGKGTKLQPFILRMEDIINGFGFSLSEKDFDYAMNKPVFPKVANIAIALQIIGFALLAHFLFGIAWMHLSILLIGLLLLLFII